MSNPAQAPRDAASTGVPGLVFLDTASLQIAIVVSPWTSVAYKANGVSRQDLLAVMSSVPLASNDVIVIPDEPPLSALPTHEEVATIVNVDPEKVGGEFGYS